MQYRRKVRGIFDLQVSDRKFTVAGRPIRRWSLFFDDSGCLLRDIEVLDDPLHAIEIEFHLREYPAVSAHQITNRERKRRNALYELPGCFCECLRLDDDKRRKTVPNTAPQCEQGGKEYDNGAQACKL